MGGRRGRLISTQDREQANMLIAEARQAGALKEKSCAEIGITIRTLQRWRLDIKGQINQRSTAKRPIPKTN